MRQYQGAVFFVDMLGIGALTQGQVTLSDCDFRTWGLSPLSSPTANLFCGQLLTQFRSCLSKISRSHKNVKIAQLSDCAYIWSDSVVSVMDAAREFMWSSIGIGLLSRGGIAYGEIVEPNKTNKTIGQFVLGSAVTRAVGLEKSGKGCRIFIDDIIYEHSTCTHGSPFKKGDIKVLKNHLDGSIVKEFCWYKTGGSSGDWHREEHSSAERIITLLTKLQYCPRFNWNEASLQGCIQLACSIDSISDVTSEFIGNGNYILKSEDYLEFLPGHNERDSVLFKQVLIDRLKDVSRFFIKGERKNMIYRTLGKRIVPCKGGS